MGNNTRQLSVQAIEAISQRLAALADLRLPAQLRRQGQDGPTEISKQNYLRNLLLHDPGVFLERHGSSLTVAEREEFDCLRGDYEVSFYLKVLEDQQDAHKQGQVARNRRLAFMNRLEREGAYFSEKEMRERQPGLYHQYIGQYRPPEEPAGPGGSCQAGAILADSIMRQQDELSMRQRQQAEQRQWDQAEEESEEEEESEGEGGEAQHGRVRQQQDAASAAVAGGHQQRWAGPTAATGGPSTRPGEAAAIAAAAAAAAADAAAAGGGSDEEDRQGEGAGRDGGEGEGDGDDEGDDEGDGDGGSAPAAAFVHIPEDEQQEYAAAFLDAMRQRFLSGLDAGVDYAAIDADAELDEDWAEQQRRDAEDAYFGGDD